MNWHTILGRAAAAALALGLSACGDSLGGGGVIVDTNVDSVLPSAPVGLRLQLAAAAPPPAPALQPAGDEEDERDEDERPVEAGTLAVTAATVQLEHVELALPGAISCDRYRRDIAARAASGATDLRAAQCGAGGSTKELRFDGPFRVDLSTGDSQPSLANLAIPVGRYDRIDLRIEDVDEDDATAGDPLAGWSLLAFGSYTTAVASPLEIALRFNEDIRFEAPGGVELQAAGAQSLVVQIADDAWFAGVAEALAECLRDAEKSPRDGERLRLVEDGPCDGIEDLLKENFKSAGQLDREIEDDEDGEDEEDED